MTDPSIDGDPPVILMDQDLADSIAFLELLREAITRAFDRCLVPREDPSAEPAPGTT